MGAVFVNWTLEEAAARNDYVFDTFRNLVVQAKIFQKPSKKHQRRTIPEATLLAFERQGKLRKPSPPSDADLFTLTEVAALLNVPFQMSDGWCRNDDDIKIVLDDRRRCCISGSDVLKLMKKGPGKQSDLNDNESYAYKNRELLRRLYGGVAVLISKARVQKTSSSLGELDAQLDSMDWNDVPYLVSLASEPILAR